MVEVKEVKSLKEKREFLNFPIRLYKGNPNFVPPLFMDERKIFRKDYVYYDTCEAVYYNAYREGRMVGRISGILQKAANEKNGEKRVRFTRFDSINDREVSDALFEAVEKWALEKGMDEVVGPLGFSDLEREGLLIEGFDELSTYEEQYNAEYYQELIEARGYVKEVDWTESRIYPPKNDDGSLKRIADKLMKRYDLHFGESKSVNDFLYRYADGFFEILDKSYDKLYGTVPFTPGMKKLMIDNFKLIIDLDHVAAILDNTGKVVCIGICFPSIAKAVQKSKGHLTPAALVRLLKAIKKPEIIDLGLIGVDPEWAMRGVSVAISAELERMLRQPGILYAETNLNLEDNAMIQNQWKRFREVKHKRRRSFVKKLKAEDGR
jgi:hypothetical protein